MLSIIIPTLNEEDYLPLLLDSIKEQDFDDYEIIVADAGSVDKTLEIAKHYNCIITKGGKVAVGRNNGAKVAKGDMLFFLDADVILPENFLEKTINEFKERNLDVIGFKIHPFPHKEITYFFVNIFYNRIITKLENKFPHLSAGVLVKREVFKILNGYDETIKFAEDYDLARRSVKLFKFGIIKSDELWVSDRRWRKDGWIKVGIKHLIGELHTSVIGPVRSDILNYKFNHYKDNDNQKKR